MQLLERIVEALPDALLVVDADGRLRLANREAERRFGLTRDKLAERTIGHLIRGGLHSGRPLDGSAFNAEMIGAGGPRPVSLTLRPIDSDAGRVTLCVVRDAEPERDALRRELREKELLLQEIHHRVKNNLSVVASLLYLQSTRTADPETIAMLAQCQDRVRSMALVHQTLARSANLAALPFEEYVAELCRELERSQVPPGQAVVLETRLERLPLRAELAVPCGLILNELVSNAIRHGFPGGRAGRIVVTLRRLAEADGAGIVEIEVRDDGVGAGAASGAPGGSLGLRLVESLALQVRARFTLSAASPGTLALVRLPLDGAVA